MAVDGKVIFVATVGSIFLYSGVKGLGLSKTTRDLLTGKNPANDPSASGGVAVNETSVSTSAIGVAPGTGTATGKIPSAASVLNEYGIGGNAAPIVANGSPSQNRSLGRFLAAGVGWTGAQWTALDTVVNGESGWSNTAQNPTSTAYGIGQNINPSTYPKAGQKAHGSNPHAQIVWTLKYIKSRYGDPINALAHERKFGWY